MLACLRPVNSKLFRSRRRYGGGFAQHIYLHANRIASVWGNDREVLTTDGDESVGNFSQIKPHIIYINIHYNMS